MIAKNLQGIKLKIQAAFMRTQRQSGVELLAVTKQVSVEQIEQAIVCGITQIGENKVQEAQAKFDLLPRVNRHMIGHLQSNKVRRAVELFDVIQSVDSLELLQKIDRVAQENNKVQICLAQIKVSQEPSKFGMDPQQLDQFLENAARLQNVKVQGIMCMAPYFQESQNARPYFARCRKLFDQFFKQPDAILSMGMSGDFECAVEEGSTMVRVGSGLFGSRL